MKSILFCIFLILIAMLGLAQENLVIRKIKFQGNKHFPNYRLKEEITMESSFWIKEKIFGREPVYYTKQLYEDDIKRLKIFYQKEGYLNVSFGSPEISINNKKKVELRFTINEGEPIQISGITFLIDSIYSLNDVFPQREKNILLYKTETAAARIFRDASISNDKLLIAGVFSDNGYPYTRVEHKLNVDVSNNSTEVQWFVNRGPLSYFGETSIVGNSRVPGKTILRQLAYKEGDVWSKSKIDQSQKQIYNQGNYRVASLRTQIEKEYVDTIPMQIQIKEAPRWSVRFGAGYGREDKLRVLTELQYLGFITNTGRLNFYAKHSSLEPYNLYLKFSQPSFLLPINTLSIYPFVQSQDEPGYQLDKMGYTVTFLQNLSEQLNTSFGYIYEDVKLDTTGYSANNNSTDIESVYKKKGITIGAIYNNADPILDPIRGYALSFNVKTNHTLFSGEMPFYRILTEYKTYFGLKKGVVLALKAKIGGVKRSDNGTFIPVEEKFFAGGSHSVRGWSRSDLGPHDDDGTPTGGNSLFECSTEFRFDIGEKLKLNFFIDAGNVWENSFSYRLTDLHYATGSGIRYKTPIGPAGIDFARPVFDDVKSWQIHFNIGHSF